jgi:hypothetical protein
MDDICEDGKLTGTGSGLCPSNMLYVAESLGFNYLIKS